MILIGGSAGSIEVIIEILKALPQTFSATIIIIIHRGNQESGLARLLQSYTHLFVKDVEDKEPVLQRHIYLAPPDYHVLLEHDGTFSLDGSEKIHWCRPSIDATFETAADCCGSNIIAVLLSGANEDGAAGLSIIANRGGQVIVQDPDEAEVSVMPSAAIKQVPGASVLSIEEIVSYLASIE